MSGGGPSILNILLLYVSLLGLGALGGYAAFYASFSERCSALLRETEGLHNASKQVYVDKYEAAMEGQRQCMSDSTVRGELQKLQGTLESQSNLADRHQALLDKQEQTLAKLSALQELSQENGNTIHELREKLSQMRMELTTEKQMVEMVTRERDTLESELQGRLGETQGMLELREQKVQELLSKAEEYDFWMPLISEEVALMKNYFLQRDHARCKLQFGSGPFKVEFTLSFPPSMGEEGPNSFVMELVPLSDMPHTIYTFLDLVDLNLFEGSAFIAANDQQIEGGSPNHADVKHSVKLYERYAKHGYHRHLLGYNEYSEKHPHTPFTVGFSGGAHPGPTLVINMADNTEARGPQADGRGGEPCFGTIVSGFDTLERIQATRKSSDGYRFAKNVVIQTVRVIANEVER